MAAKQFVVLFFCIFLLIVKSLQQQTNCPHTQGSFTDFNTKFSGQVVNGSNLVVAAGENILITSFPNNVILNSITVNGRLVFSDVNVNVNVNWMRVNNGGFLIAGSATCTIQNKISITFWGPRQLASVNDIGVETDGVGFGSKGLGIGNGGSIQLYGAATVTWTTLAQPALVNATTITLTDAVDWRVGDKIIIATTDYYPNIQWRSGYPSSINWQLSRANFPDQNEEKTITAVSADKKTLTLNTPIKYLKWSDQYQKAEVGLLNRRIILQGDGVESTGMGGHVMIRNAATVKIVGVEFTRMGQLGNLGRYPVHFHMINPIDKTGQGYILDRNSFHHLHQRCVVIHNSNGVTVSNNVAYRTNGHCYFLEDGPEENSVFDHNLGIDSRPIASEVTNTLRLVPSDAKPAIFWITNPNNTFINNAAVQAFFGYWYVMPAAATGPSAMMFGTYDTHIRPRYLPLQKFDNNVAHSTFSGLFVDEMLNPDGTTSLASYNPRLGPYVEDVQPWQLQMVDATFTRVTSYKNRQSGIWTRGGPIVVSDSVIIDNRVCRDGITLVPGPSIIKSSLIVAESENIGTPLANEGGRSRPDQWNQNEYLKGVSTYDNGGPQYYTDLTFIGFSHNSFRKAGALGVLRNGPFIHQTRNKYSRLKFINSNPFWMNNATNGDNERGIVLQDIDGSTTGITAGGWIVSSTSLLIHDPAACRRVDDFNAHICPFFPNGYGQLFITDNNFGSTPITDPSGTPYPVSDGEIRATFYEIGNPQNFLNVEGAKVNSDTKFQFMTNMIMRRGYMIRFTHNLPTPKDLQVSIQSTVKGDYAFVAIPYPPSALPFTITGDVWGSASTRVTFTQVDALTKLSRTTYFYDSTLQLLYLKITNQIDDGSGYYDVRWNHVDYSYDGWSVRVVASCTSCYSTVSEFPASAVPVLDEEQYQADLNPCQEADNPNASSSKNLGVGYFFFNPKTRELDFNIHHNASLTATSLQFGIGSPMEASSRMIPLTFTGFSPVRGRVRLSHDEWVQLVSGNLFVRIFSSDFPNGELRGNIFCSGSCTLPPPLQELDSPCTAHSYSVPFFEDATQWVWPYFGAGVWSPANDPNPTFIDTQNKNITAVCGTEVLWAKIRRGSFSIYKHTGSTQQPVPEINRNFYTHLQIYIRAAPGYYNVPLGVQIRTSDNFLIGRFDNMEPYSNTFKIDDTTWTRILLPISEMQWRKDAEPIQNLNFYLSNWNSPPMEFYMDEIRWVQTVPTTSVTKVSSVRSYSPLCGQRAGVVVGSAPHVVISATTLLVMIISAVFLL